ncbi:hypothetical protein U1Q18_000901, partial [Sarracenia purpurea var. burkii]
MIHQIKECTYARDVWKLVYGGGAWKEKKGPRDTLTWATDFLRCAKQEEWETFLMVIWSLWRNRNLIIFEGKWSSMETVKWEADRHSK